jgi:ketosteroid isomerase-like protein
MSEENVEVVRRMYEEWQRGGGTAEAIPVGLFGEDFEWDQSTYPLVGFPIHGVGLDNLLGALQAYWSTWDHYAAQVKELVDAGDNVFCVVHEKAGVGETEVLVERDLFQVWTLRHGLIVKWLQFQTREEALRVAGVSE